MKGIRNKQQQRTGHKKGKMTGTTQRCGKWLYMMVRKEMHRKKRKDTRT